VALARSTNLSRYIYVGLYPFSQPIYGPQSSLPPAFVRSKLDLDDELERVLPDLDPSSYTLFSYDHGVGRFHWADTTLVSSEDS
jgi:hypothetical protein